MDWANSSKRSLWKARRGCKGFGSTESIPMWIAFSSRVGGGVVGGRVGMREPSPLPSALRGFSSLFMVQNLFGEFDIAFGSPGTRIIPQNRFTEARRFRQANATRNHSA